MKCGSDDGLTNNTKYRDIRVFSLLIYSFFMEKFIVSVKIKRKKKIKKCNI